MAAAPPDLTQVKDGRGWLRLLTPIQVEDKRGGCTISVAAVLQTPIRLWISAAAASLSAPSGLRIGTWRPAQVGNLPHHIGGKSHTG